jgi:hypothetical protein
LTVRLGAVLGEHAGQARPRRHHGGALAGRAAPVCGYLRPAPHRPDGSAILWVKGPDGKPKSIASNEPDPDGLVTFPVSADGTLGACAFHDGGGGSPFYIALLHGRPDTFVLGEALGDGIAMGTIDGDGDVIGIRRP